MQFRPCNKWKRSAAIIFGLSSARLGNTSKALISKQPVWLSKQFKRSTANRGLMTRVEDIDQNRSPTPAQRKQERALTLLIWLDLLIVAPYVIVGIAVGSLAMIAEVL